MLLSLLLLVLLSPFSVLVLLIQSVTCPSETDNNSEDQRRLDECHVVPRGYVTTLCGAAAMQYLSQQIILWQHEGLRKYISHFVDMEKSRPYSNLTRLIVVKSATVVATLILAFFPQRLQALDILLIVLAITLVQGLAQTIENMIVHVAQLEAKKMRRHRRPLYDRAIHEGLKRLGLSKREESESDEHLREESDVQNTRESGSCEIAP